MTGSFCHLEARFPCSTYLKEICALLHRKYPFFLIMAILGSSEMSVKLYRTTQRLIPEDTQLHLKSTLLSVYRNNQSLSETSKRSKSVGKTYAFLMFRYLVHTSHNFTHHTLSNNMDPRSGCSCLKYTNLVVKS
jgi:hypothetical protein